MIARRGLLAGMLAAPAIVRTPGLLMPVRPLATVACGTYVPWRAVIYLPARIHPFDQPGITWSRAHDADKWLVQRDRHRIYATAEEANPKHRNATASRHRRG